MECLLDLIVIIKKLALSDPTSSSDEDDTVNRQTALYSLKLLTRLLTNVDPKPFIQVCNIYI